MPNGDKLYKKKQPETAAAAVAAAAAADAAIGRAPVAAVAAGDHHSAALLHGGSLYTWGPSLSPFSNATPTLQLSLATVRLQIHAAARIISDR